MAKETSPGQLLGGWNDLDRGSTVSTKLLLDLFGRTDDPIQLSAGVQRRR